jgi:hypothetical protein
MTARALNRHERTCDATVRHIFPGGAYKFPQTIFDLLADKGIDIPEDLKYFPYRATLFYKWGSLCTSTRNCECYSSTTTVSTSTLILLRVL